MAGVVALIRNNLAAFLNLIYPKQCQGCGFPLHYKNKLYLCKECLKKIKINRPPFCVKCGHPIYGASGLEAVCGKCIGTKYAFDRSFSCCFYDGLIKDLIHKFKYERKKYLVYLFDRLMANFAKKYINTKSIDMIIPVPLHRGKFSQRGFDQSLLLSKNLSETLRVPLSCGILTKNKDTTPQTNLDKEQRLRNVKGVFSVKNKKGIDKKAVLLIDDVSTTAATADECANALKESGAKSVFLLTLAKGL